MKVSNQILQQITSKVEIERIYQFSYRFLDKEYHRLLIVLDSKCGVSPATLQPTIDMCLDEVKDLTYMLMPIGEVKSELKNGNLFFTSICTTNNLIYHDGKKKFPLQTPEEIECIQIKAKDHLLSALHKMLDFEEGVEFYLKKGNFHQAAFMLHQSAEISCRAFDMAIFNKNRPSHSIHEHLNLICRYLPAVRSLFPKSDEYKYGLLKFLDRAYISVRYRNDYLIEEEQLNVLKRKILRLIIWFQTYFIDCLQSLDDLRIDLMQAQGPVSSMLTIDVSTEPVCKGINASKKLDVLNTSQKNKLDALIDKICKQHPVSQILALGVNTSTHQNNSIYKLEQMEEQSAHCYLLVILKGSQEVKSFTSNQGDLKIIMLIHHEKEITDALSRHDRFFIQSLKTGTEIYKSVERPIQFNIPEPDWQHSLKSANHFFENRLKHLADMFLESAKDVNQHIDDSAFETRLLLLTHCIEQVCVSYIYINTGYRVNNHHLPFLFDLCGLIDTGILKILYQNTTVEKRRMEALMNCVQHIRDKSKCNLGHEDFSILLKRCKNLVFVVKNNCETEIDRLRSLAYPKDKESKLTV